MKIFLWLTFLDFIWVLKHGFRCWSGKGGGEEIRDKQSRKNSTTLGQFPDCASGNMHNIFKLFHRAKEHSKSDFGINRLVMSMCRDISCVLGRWCLLWPVCSLGKNLLSFAMLHFVLQGQLACHSRYLLMPYFWIPVPCDEKDIFFFGVSSGSSCRSS